LTTEVDANAIAPLLDAGRRRDRAGKRVEHEPRLGVLVTREDQAALERNRRGGNHRFALQQRVAIAVHEEQRGVRARCHRFAQEDRRQPGIAARRAQQRAPEVIGLAGQAVAARRQRSAARGGEPFDDEAHGLPAHVRVESPKQMSHR